MKAIQAMVGHARASMPLDVYADLLDDDLQAVAERLDAVARAAPVGGMTARATVAQLDARAASS